MIATQILVTAKSVKELKHRIEETIATAQKWFTENSLKINPTKTEIIIFGNKGKNETINFTVKEDGNEQEIQNKKRSRS